MGVGDFIANTGRVVGDWMGKKAASETGAITRQAVENTNHLKNAGESGFSGQTSVQQGRTTGEKIKEGAIAVASEFSPVVKAVAENRGRDTQTQSCAIIGAAVGDIGSKVIGAGLGTAATVGTGGVGVAVGVAVGTTARLFTAKPPAAPAATAAAGPPGTGVPEATRPAQPIKVDLNLGVPPALPMMSAGVGASGGGGSMADRLAARMGENLTTVASNTGAPPENRTHHAPATPSVVMRPGGAMGM